MYYSPKHAVMIGKYCFRHTSTIEQQLMLVQTRCIICREQQLCIFFPLPPSMFLLSLCCTFQQFFLDSFNFWKFKCSKLVASEIKYCQRSFLWGRSLYATTSMCLPFWCQSWAHMWVLPCMTACVVQSPWQSVILLGEWKWYITSWLELGMYIYLSCVPL